MPDYCLSPEPFEPVSSTHAKNREASTPVVCRHLGLIPLFSTNSLCLQIDLTKVWLQMHWSQPSVVIVLCPSLPFVPPFAVPLSH